MSEGMTHGGVYDRFSDYQLRGARAAATLVDAVAGEIVPEDARGAVAMADYGCAQGRVSNELVRLAIERLRTRYPDIPVSVFHNDVLGNDWAALFERLRDDDAYLRIPGGPITPLVAAQSFYERVTPKGVVDLGMSFAAAQWLAEPGPTTGGGALYFDQLEGRPKAEMAEQAAADWTRFLELRADELAPGGRLVMDLMGVPDGAVAAGHDMWHNVRSICADMVAEGLLDGRRVDEFVLPVYERSTEEVRRPFGEAIGEYLQLEHLDIHRVPNPVAEHYETDGDAAAYARDLTGFFRAFSEPSLRAGFGATDEAMQELYRRVESAVLAQAPTFAFDVNAILLVAARQ